MAASETFPEEPVVEAANAEVVNLAQAVALMPSQGERLEAMRQSAIRHRRHGLATILGAMVSHEDKAPSGASIFKD